MLPPPFAASLASFAFATSFSAAMLIATAHHSVLRRSFSSSSLFFSVYTSSSVRHFAVAQLSALSCVFSASALSGGFPSASPAPPSVLPPLSHSPSVAVVGAVISTSVASFAAAVIAFAIVSISFLLVLFFWHLIMCPPSLISSPHSSHVPFSPALTSPVLSRMAIPVAVGTDWLLFSFPFAVNPAGLQFTCSMAANSLWSCLLQASPLSAPLLFDSFLILWISFSVSLSAICRLSDLSAATIHPSTAYTHSRGIISSSGRSLGSSARCDFAIASAYAFGAMPPPCAFTHTYITCPCRPLLFLLAIRSMCLIIASTCSAPVRPDMAPSGPSSPHRHASSIICSDGWQSHIIITLSPALCRVSVRSIATSSAIMLSVPGGSAPPLASSPSHEPHDAARAPVSPSSCTSISSLLPSTAYTLSLSCVISIALTMAITCFVASVSIFCRSFGSMPIATPSSDSVSGSSFSYVLLRTHVMSAGLFAISCCAPVLISSQYSTLLYFVSSAFCFRFLRASHLSAATSRIAFSAVSLAALRVFRMLVAVLVASSICLVAISSASAASISIASLASSASACSVSFCACLLSLYALVSSFVIVSGIFALSFASAVFAIASFSCTLACFAAFAFIVASVSCVSLSCVVALFASFFAVSSLSVSPMYFRIGVLSPMGCVLYLSVAASRSTFAASSASWALFCCSFISFCLLLSAILASDSAVSLVVLHAAARSAAICTATTSCSRSCASFSMYLSMSLYVSISISNAFSSPIKSFMSSCAGSVRSASSFRLSVSRILCSCCCISLPFRRVLLFSPSSSSVRAGVAIPTVLRPKISVVCFCFCFVLVSASALLFSACSLFVFALSFCSAVLVFVFVIPVHVLPAFFHSTLPSLCASSSCGTLAPLAVTRAAALASTSIDGVLLCLPFSPASPSVPR